MTDINEEDDDWVSKSQRKRECDDVLELGEKMITMNQDELDQITMDSELRQALDDAQRIKSNNALKRQKHYIAKVMRGLDDQTLSGQVERVLHKHDIYNAEFKRMEKWRDSIIENGDRGINDFLEQYPHADRHHLRQLVRNAVKEKKNNKPPAAYRQIFKYIREVSDEATSNDANDY
ncbi:MAG: ribosome-associated protein [endosymbiont of Galathealinum brachiosum]|uniref:Dual-action ribosomal maturation protein DarP n=1 Tax=endosymbiont of Galathealinum brachiosum TaxID=2200906 RepID=A0A370D8S0_9GAMM|nr:MAG: ribosome-associated protein [endosymbiont of Galathealinum brachiosum]